MKKYCKYCNKKYGVKNNFCPICGRKLESIFDLDVNKAFESYLKGTKFYLMQDEAYNDGYHRYRFINRGIDSEKDTKKIIKRIVKDKPDFLTMDAFVVNDFRSITICVRLEVLIEGEKFFLAHLNLPYNKCNFNLISNLLTEDNLSELTKRCQHEIAEREYRLKVDALMLNLYQKFKKQLKKEE